MEENRETERTMREVQCMGENRETEKTMKKGEGCVSSKDYREGETEGRERKEEREKEKRERNERSWRGSLYGWGY
jgi:hypothetical protein